MAQGWQLNMDSFTTTKHWQALPRQLSFMGLSLVSAIVLAQAVDHLDPGANFDTRQTDQIFDSAGKWRQAPPAENQWRSIPDDTVQDRRFHFGADSAYEEMQYQSNDRYRSKGSTYDDYRPSPLFRYNF